MIVRKRWILILLLSLGSASCATAPARGPFEVTVEVDFGSADKPAVRQMVQVSPGATPQDATAQVFPV